MTLSINSFDTAHQFFAVHTRLCLRGIVNPSARLDLASSRRRAANFEVVIAEGGEFRVPKLRFPTASTAALRDPLNALADTVDHAISFPIIAPYVGRYTRR